jgi:hypothetical protein
VKYFRLHNGHEGWNRPGDSELTVNDSLFAMLDGQIIRGRSGAWRAEVMSILTEEGETWVQVGQAGCPSTSVVLRLRESDLADAAIAALSAWTDLPEDSRPGRIEVGPDTTEPHDNLRRGRSQVERIQLALDRIETNRATTRDLRVYAHQLQSRRLRH